MKRFIESRTIAGRGVLVAVLIGLGVSWAGAAAAQMLEIPTYGFQEPAAAAAGEDEDAPPPPPAFRAAVVGAIPGLAEKDFVLIQDDVDPAVEIAADKVKSYVESDDPMALVVLVQGDERWMGNETYRDEEDPDRIEGAFTGIGSALDALGKAGPPGSKAALLVYTMGKAEPKLAMGPADQLGAASLGSQKDFEGNIVVPLLVGLDESMNVFDTHADYRKILVVIGDGTGQEESIAAGLKDRINKLKQRKVEVFTIHYEAIVSGSPEGQNNMKQLGYSSAKHATSRDNFAAFADGFVQQIGARYYATFPGCSDKTPPVCFKLDGQRHTVLLKAGDLESDVFEVAFPVWNQPEPESSLWWLWLLIILLVVVIVIVILVVRARGGEEEPAPMPMPVEMAPPPEPQAQKTMMINAGDGGGGMPIVGWIVPLNGPNKYQTYKLLQGVTKIGSGPDCNIVIQDGFMSHVHAEIICSPQGFTFKDGGSTNGSQVNDRRVGNHELVDNDQLTMGKTNFKFKSIN
ncbi:FHA domain-containing protein [Haliangium sp.]|uniref:FHA domain-containing protein n=1 Tax=Haliangium sp. TaxID=2663208 RepID=UPI003D0CECE9